MQKAETEVPNFSLGSRGVGQGRFKELEISLERGLWLVTNQLKHVPGMHLFIQQLSTEYLQCE